MVPQITPLVSWSLTVLVSRHETPAGLTVSRGIPLTGGYTHMRPSVEPCRFRRSQPTMRLRPTQEVVR